MNITMTILHASIDADLLTRLRQMVGSAARVDNAVSSFFMSGFNQVADDLVCEKSWDLADYSAFRS